jgi:gas vesicle protein
MSHHEGYGGAHLLLAFIAGGVAGAATALLLTPHSGPETRDTLRGWSREAQDKAGRVPVALRRAFHDASEAARRAFSETFAKSIDATEKGQ